MPSPSELSTQGGMGPVRTVGAADKRLLRPEMAREAAQRRWKNLVLKVQEI